MFMNQKLNWFSETMEMTGRKNLMLNSLLPLSLNSVIILLSFIFLLHIIIPQRTL